MKNKEYIKGLLQDAFGPIVFVIVSTILFMGFTLAVLSCAASSHNVSNEIEYYKDPRTNVCLGTMPGSGNQYFVVECTPEIEKLTK